METSQRSRRAFIRNSGLALTSALLAPHMMQAHGPSHSSAPFDALVIGGSFAGLSAAMALGRACRTVLVVDAGQPCNRMVHAAHNLITHDGEHPGALLAKARAELASYGTVQLRSATVTGLSGTDGEFHVVAGPERWTAKKILLATGIKDQLPPIPGFAACWGHSALHCPFCHGYEVKDEALGILAGKAMGHEFARLIRNWSPQCTLFTNGPADLTSEQRDGLTTHGVRIDERRVRELLHEKGMLHHLAFDEGDPVPLKALFARVPFGLPEGLIAAAGCALGQSGHVQVNEFQQTSIPGIYAAGDLATPMRSLAAAIAAGNMAGVVITHSLMSH